MKLVVITSIGKGGFGWTVPELVIARDLLRRGHEVAFIVPEEGEFSAAVRELGIEVIERSYASKARTVWKRAARVLGLGALARKYADADAVIGFRFSSTLLALGLGRRLGVPTMAFLHGYTDRAAKYLNHGCHQVDLVAAVSTEALDAYDRATVGHRSPDQKLELILNGIDDEEFRATAAELNARTACNIPTDVKLVGIAGTTERKGVDVFVKAAAKLADKHPDAHFMICGEFRSAELRQKLTEIAERAGLASRLHEVGFQTNIGAFMTASDIWTMPSRNDAFPLVGLEVAAAGRPIVASGIGGIPEMVEDGETGYLIPSDDVDALADRLDTLLGDRELRERMGARGMSFVREKLSLQKQVDRFEGCLQSLMQRRAAVPPIKA